MIILQVTPLSQNFWVAAIESLLLLALAAYIGWWIARRMFSARIEGLENDIHLRHKELNECNKSKLALTVPVANGIAPTVAESLIAVPVVPVAPPVPDDLKIIEGIGPKIEELLNREGILTFAQLAAASVESIKTILDAAGPRFQIHDPGTWPEQSAMARDGKWEELKVWQDELNKGRLE